MGVFVECSDTRKGLTHPNRKSRAIRYCATSAVGTEVIERAKALTLRLEAQKRLKAELLRAKLRGEVNQADYAQANADFDDEIDAITQELHTLQSQRGTLDAFLRFAELMLVDVAAAWQQADVERRIRVQNFLFQGGIAYHENDKFLNTVNPTLFQHFNN